MLGYSGIPRRVGYLPPISYDSVLSKIKAVCYVHEKKKNLINHDHNFW